MRRRDTYVFGKCGHFVAQSRTCGAHAGVFGLRTRTPAASHTISPYPQKQWRVDATALNRLVNRKTYRADDAVCGQ